MPGRKVKSDPSNIVLRVYADKSCGHEKESKEGKGRDLDLRLIQLVRVLARQAADDEIERARKKETLPSE